MAHHHDIKNAIKREQEAHFGRYFVFFRVSKNHRQGKQRGGEKKPRKKVAFVQKNKHFDCLLLTKTTGKNFKLIFHALISCRESTKIKKIDERHDCRVKKPWSMSEHQK